MARACASSSSRSGVFGVATSRLASKSAIRPSICFLFSTSSSSYACGAARTQPPESVAHSVGSLAMDRDVVQNCGSHCAECTRDALDVNC